MLHTRLALSLAFAALLPTVAAAGPLDAYLPKSGTIAGHAITFSIAPEDQAISRQFRHAVQDNMDWFKKAVTSNPAGKPLPYDRKMGVTEAQYQQLLHMKSDAHEGAAVKVGIVRGADGTISFAPEGETAAALSGVSVSQDEKSVKTPVGTLSVFNEIHQKDAGAPIGEWNGVEWAQVGIDKPDGTGSGTPSAKIAFGKRQGGGGVMYYQVAPYEGHKEQSIVVYYDLD